MHWNPLHFRYFLIIVRLESDYEDFFKPEAVVRQSLVQDIITIVMVSWPMSLVTYVTIDPVTISFSCVAVCLLDVPQKIKNPKKLKNKNCVCTFPGPVFCIIVSAWTCMIMEFQLVDGVQFFLVLSVLVALPPLW